MLTGTLDDFTLADVLRLIAGARRTGGLDVTRDCGAGSLYFRDGTISHALARYDRRNGAASPARAVEDLVFDLMRWSRGEFAWSPGAADAPAVAAEAAVDVDDLLREVSRRLEELAQIQTLVPSEETVLAMAPQPPEGAVQINITPAEWRVLVLVDGHRAVAEIAEAAGLDGLEAMKLLYGLATAGLVATDEAPSTKEVSDTADMTAVSAVSDAPVGEHARTNGWRGPANAPAEAPREADPVADEPAAAPGEGPDADLEDPFLAGFVEAETASPFDGLDVLPGEELHESPGVDRSTAARELAGLFDDVDPGRAPNRGSTPPAPPQVPRRVEDDEQVTQGLISRLIDGVKGL